MAITFTRKAAGELLLVAANFDDSEAEINVTLPAHAFDYLSVKEKKVMAVDLLTKERESMMLRPDGQVRMLVPARGVRVWKMKV